MASNIVVLVCVFLLYVGPGTTSASTLQSVTTIDEVLARMLGASSAAVAAAVTELRLLSWVSPRVIDTRG